MPHSIHIDRELLRAVHRGNLPAKLLSQVGLRHLLDVCPHCRQEVKAFEREIGGPLSSSGNLASVLQGILRNHMADLKRLQRDAERDLQELMTLSEEERFAKIGRARRRFRGVHLVQLLLEQCEERFTTAPVEARHLAELARSVIQHSPIRIGAFEWLALTVAHLANACRAAGDRRQAHEHFEHVRYLINQYAITDPDMLARIADLESSLHTDQRRFAEAETLLRRALTLYRSIGSNQDIARVMLNLANVFYVQGLFYKAIEVTEEALKLVPAAPDSKLYLMGRYNLTLQMAEAGRPDQAAVLLASDQALYQQFPGPWTQLRLLWLQAKIAAGLGDKERAIDLFSQVREGFIEQGIGYDAAIVSLELSLLYLRQGRNAEIRELAESMVVIFKAQDVHREAVAALMLFQQAAGAEALTDTLLTDLRAYFRTARRVPYPFRPSSI